MGHTPTEPQIPRRRRYRPVRLARRMLVAAGALCLALSLAFGLGGREVAGEVVRNEYTRHEKPAPKRRTTRKTTK